MLLFEGRNGEGNRLNGLLLKLFQEVIVLGLKLRRLSREHN